MADAKLDGEEVGDSREHSVNSIQHGRDEQKREFDRLGDAGKKRCQRGGDHYAADLGAIFRTRAMPYRQRGRRQPPHLEEIAPGQMSSGRVACGVAVYLAADDLACLRIDVLPDLKEKRHVPDVV